jgi:benzil reductase ((S)-benzoin forming)
MKRIVIITGTNKGLGKAFVDILIKKENYFIISLSRSLNETQRKYSKDNFHFLKTDLSSKNLVKDITKLDDIIGNKPTFFINNASIIEPIVKIENISELEIDNMLLVNIKSTMIITNYLLKKNKQNKLCFINISSGAANKVISNWSMYCASKACVQMFFNVAQEEYKEHDFFNVDPGVMDTDMQKKLRESDFPDLNKFKNFKKDGKLNKTLNVASEILKKYVF